MEMTKRRKSLGVDDGGGREMVMAGGAGVAEIHGDAGAAAAVVVIAGIGSSATMVGMARSGAAVIDTAQTGAEFHQDWN